MNYREEAQSLTGLAKKVFDVLDYHDNADQYIQRNLKLAKEVMALEKAADGQIDYFEIAKELSQNAAKKSRSQVLAQSIWASVRDCDEIADMLTNDSLGG